MRVEKINSVFEKIGRLQIEHRKLCLAVLSVWTIISLLGLPKFRVQNNNEGWFLETDETKINENKFKETFGNTESVMFLVSSSNVFHPQVLEMIQTLGDTLMEEVPFASNLQSITSLKLPVNKGGRVTAENPFGNGIPQDETELNEKRAQILGTDTLVNTLVSEDGTETWVLLSLLPFEDMDRDPLLVGNAVRTVLARPEFHSELWDINPVGDSYLLVEQNDTIVSVTIRAAGAGALVMLLCLVVLTRSLRGTIIPLLSTGFGIGVVFGWCGHLGIKPNFSLVTLPLMLGMALSIGYSIHYINAFRNAFARTGKREEAAVLCVTESAWPILFTVITTAATLSSFLFTPTEFLRVIGALCSAVVLSVFVYIFITVPIFLSYGKDHAEETNRQRHKNMESDARMNDRFAAYGSLILKKPAIIASMAFFIPVVVISIIGCFRIKVELGYIETIGQKVPFICRLNELLDTQLGNMYSYNVMVYFDEKDVFREPENMKKLDQLADRLAEFPLTKTTNGKPRVMSVTQIVKEMNAAASGGGTEHYTIPERKSLLIQRLALSKIADENYLRTWISEDFSKVYVSVGLAEYTLDQIEAETENAIAAAREFFPDAQIGVIGFPIKTMAMNKKVVSGEIQSICISIAVTALLMILAFTSVRVGLIGMLPNIIPVLFIGGFMGFVGFGMDMVTMMVMPMIIGIAVDDTIHFTNHAKACFEKCGNYHEAVVQAFREVGKSMAATTMILCMIFVIYIFGEITMMHRLGVMVVLGLVMALLCDYTVTPIMIYLAKPFGKETNPDGELL